MTAQQLKNSILQMAISGKLVAQEAGDEPASALLKKINAEKKRLIKEGKIKKDKVLPEVAEDEMPFDIPGSWEWVRLGEVFSINPRNMVADELEASFIPMALISDGFSNKHTFETRFWGEIKNGFTHFQNGDVGIAKITPCFENRKSVVFSDLLNGIGAGTTELHILREIAPKTMLAEYALWFVKTEFFISNGKKSFTGTAGQQRVGKSYIENTPFPLPPLAEQHRIVAAVSRLLPHIAAYAAAEQPLTALNKSFPDKLKASVLQYAIQGKLVPQDPSDEPASVLLKKIHAQNKNAKKVGGNGGDNFNYGKTGLPEGWEWARLGDVGDWGAGATPSRTNQEYYNGGTIPWLKTGDLNDGFIVEIPEKITSLALKETGVRLNPIGSVLIAMYGATIGKVGILGIEATTNQACCACQPFPEVYNKYLFYYLLSQRENFKRQGYGGAQPNMSKEKIINTPFPLPPLAEQHRIVKRIEEFLTYLKMI